MAALIIFVSGPVHAEWAVMPSVSTLGAGVDLAGELSSRVQLRGGFHAIDIGRPMTWDNVDYDGELRLRNVQGLFDFYPAGGSFRVSAGAIWNQNRASGISNEDTTIEVNGIRYPVALVGTIRADAETDPVGPYLGVGWGNPIAGSRRYRLMLDIGAYAHGDPRVELTARPRFGIPLPQRYLDDLQAEEDRINEDAKEYSIYPVVSIGLAIRVGG